MRRTFCLCMVALGWTVSSVAAGDLSGTVRLESKPSARKAGQSRGAPGYEKGEVPSPREEEVENVVLYLTGKDLACTPLTRPGTQNTIVQKEKQFVPHVLPVTRGSKVYFRNNDPFPHHIYSVSQPGEFEISRHGSGSVRGQEFDREGGVEIFCGIHTKMNAYVLVVDSNYFTSPKASGDFLIRGIPSGEYRLTLWHPRIATPPPQVVKIPATGSLRLDLKL